MPDPRPPHPMSGSNPLPPEPDSVLTFLYAALHEPQNRARASLPRQIAVPLPGSIPSFDDVYGLSMTSALIDQSVLVICLTQEAKMGWMQRLREQTSSAAALDLIDGQLAEFADWRSFFCRNRYDVTVLHGARSALQEQTLSLAHVKRLVGAVPEGLIVLA